MGISIGRSVPLELGTKEGRKSLSVVPTEYPELGIGTSGIFPRNRVVVAAQPLAESPAGEAGFLLGDTILSVDGHPVGMYQDFTLYIRESQGKTVQVSLLRPGKEGALSDTVSLAVTPRLDEAEGRYLIGVQMGLAILDETRLVRNSLPQAVVKAGETSWSMGTSVFRYIYRIVKGEVKLKALSGPVNIIPMIGRVWIDDFRNLVWIISLIGINLGVMNLLPLAITDGGVLFFLLLEKLRGRPLQLRTQAIVQQVAASIFIAFFLYISVIDLGRVGMLFP
jgi:regulator of sigma E protease